MAKIFIDPGHGGRDPGAVGNGIHEADIVLDIALKMRDLLMQYSDAEVKLSREKDVFVALSERTDMANEWEADILISVHCNSNDNPNADGFETFVYTGVKERTKSFQHVLHTEIINRIHMDDRGEKQANFHMLRESDMPAVLSENGFISNKADAENLKSENFRSEIADGHVKGIASFLGLKIIKNQEAKKEAEKIPVPATGKLFRIQVGAYQNYENVVKELDRVQNELGLTDAYIVEE